MTNIRSFIVGLAVLILLFVGGIYVYQRSIKPAILKQKTEASPTPSSVSKFSTQATPTPSPVLQTNQKTNIASAPSTGEDPQNVGISISLPANSKIASPLYINGSANIQDAIVNIVILDANRMVLGSTKVTACMAANACPFSTYVDFLPSTTKTGTIELYANATQTNPQPNLQVINISF